MATLNSISLVELLKWISGLLTSARVVLNALVYNPLVDKGSQWALHIATHCSGDNQSKGLQWVFSYASLMIQSFDFM